MRNRLFVAVAGAAVLAASAHAGFIPDSPALTDFTGGGGPFASFYGTLLPSGDVVGYRFTADFDMRITALGIYDDSGSDGVLDSAHMVGLWRNSDQALLASASVDSTGAHIGAFFYADIAFVDLDAGGEYTLGAMYANDDGDAYFSGPSAVTLNGISATAGVEPGIGDLGFVYPVVTSGNLGRIGPNMIITNIPAPGALALLGVAGLASRRRRRD